MDNLKGVDKKTVIDIILSYRIAYEVCMNKIKSLMDKNNPGMIEQIKRSQPNPYSHLTKEILEQEISRLFYQGMDSAPKGENTTPIGYAGGGWYHIGRGVYYTEAGWKLFNEEISKQGFNIPKQITDAQDKS